MTLKDPMVGEPIKNTESGEQNIVPFIPQSLRNKTHICSSTNANEDIWIINVLKKVNDFHKAYKTEMFGLAKEISGFVILIRTE